MSEMGETTNQQKRGFSGTIVIVVIIAILVVAGVVYTSNNKTQTAVKEEQMAEATPPTKTPTKSEAIAETYNDGTYSVVGEYQSPGGAESIDVTLTLENGIITDANVVSNAERPTSVEMQGKFISGYKPLVVGKNIDEVKLDVVSGSSLTPKGFNDAVEKIKQQAQV